MSTSSIGKVIRCFKRNRKRLGKLQKHLFGRWIFADRLHDHVLEMVFHNQGGVEVPKQLKWFEIGVCAHACTRMCALVRVFFIFLLLLLFSQLFSTALLRMDSYLSTPRGNRPHYLLLKQPTTLDSKGHSQLNSWCVAEFIHLLKSLWIRTHRYTTQLVHKVVVVGNIHRLK